MSREERSRQTYRCELQRAASTGLIESCASTFFLLIALRAFHAGPTAKSFIASAANAGLLVTPWILGIVARRGTSVTRAAMYCAIGGGAAALAAVSTHSLTAFVVLGFLAMAASNVTTPLRTQIYSENFAAHERGRLVSHALVVRVAAVSVAGLTVGRLLGPGAARYRWLLALVALAYVNEAWTFARIPAVHLADQVSGRLRDNVRHAWAEPILRSTLTSWMLMGIANLMMFPLRVEYLGNPRYGLDFSAGRIALLTVFVPAIARILSAPAYGWVFDRANFFTIRMALNAGFAASIVMFFTGTSMVALVAGSAVFGVSQAGGDILWSLWVTKFSPPHRIADDMSVHTFTTGLRGVIAPFLAFRLIDRMSIGWMGVLCSALIVAATMVLLPELRNERMRRRGELSVAAP